MKKRTYIRIISFLSVLAVVFGVSTVIYKMRSDKLSIYLEAQREQSLMELTEALDRIEVSLKKSIYCSTGEKLLESGNELYRLSSVAKDSLSRLTEESENTEAIFKFLSQVGDYTISLSKNKVLSETDRKNLEALSDYSYSLSKEFSSLSESYYSGEISFSKALSNLESEEEKIDFLSSFNTVKESLGDYPTLLYDGPFADNVLERKPLGLNDEKEITKKEGKEIAAKILGAKIAELKEQTDENSNLPLYRFSKGEKTVAVTKKGGYLCYMTNPDYTGEATISGKEAIKRAEKYLKELGFENMKSNYYSTFDDVTTINFAYRENGITHYSDLIKVSVALDKGKIVAFDARSYLMNHRKRELSDEILKETDCRSTIGEHLQILSSDLALIPLESGEEKLCYEYHCKDKKGAEVLVYLNAFDGSEEEIMLLLYSDDGVLTK